MRYWFSKNKYITLHIYYASTTKTQKITIKETDRIIDLANKIHLYAPCFISCFTNQNDYGLNFCLIKNQKISCIFPINSKISIKDAGYEDGNIISLCTEDGILIF